MTPSGFTLTRQSLDLRFRNATLAEREWQTDAYVRIRLRGPELEGFDSPGCDDHIRLFFPASPPRSVVELREAPNREYTPLAWGPGWLDVEFAIHGTPGDRGVAAEWAASAPIGATSGVGGPRGSMIIDGTPDAWFLAGDETAVPAIRRFAAAMPADAIGTVLVEVPDACHELPVSAPAGVRVEFVYRGSARGGTVLADRLTGILAAERPAGSVFGFIAAEQAVVKPGRALLMDRWALSPEQIVVKGYWKRGDSTYHAPH